MMASGFSQSNTVPNSKTTIWLRLLNTATTPTSSPPISGYLQFLFRQSSLASTGLLVHRAISGLSDLSGSFSITSTGCALRVSTQDGKRSTFRRARQVSSAAGRRRIGLIEQLPGGLADEAFDVDASCNYRVASCDRSGSGAVG